MLLIQNKQRITEGDLLFLNPRETFYVHARFEAFTAVIFRIEVFWCVTLCNVVVGC